jgi:hypothetical protein
MADSYNKDWLDIAKPRRSPDENAQPAWHQILCVSQMLDSMVQAGAVIELT